MQLSSRIEDWTIWQCCWSIPKIWNLWIIPETKNSKNSWKLKYSGTDCFGIEIPWQYSTIARRSFVILLQFLTIYLWKSGFCVLFNTKKRKIWKLLTKKCEWPDQSYDPILGESEIVKNSLAQSAGAVEYTDYTSAEG